MLTIIKVVRHFKGDTYTIGKMYVNGTYFCDTLEDKDRGLTQETPDEEIKKIKVYGQTAIPVGVYKATLEMSPKFGRILVYLHDIPGFSGILIHRGNTDADTLGCILIGENKVKCKVINSTKYEEALMELLQAVGGDIQVVIGYEDDKDSK
jgi:hypothetical protein